MRGATSHTGGILSGRWSVEGHNILIPKVQTCVCAPSDLNEPCTLSYLADEPSKLEHSSPKARGSNLGMLRCACGGEVP